jgi:hypothetical protein
MEGQGLVKAQAHTEQLQRFPDTEFISKWKDEFFQNTFLCFAGFILLLLRQWEIPYDGENPTQSTLDRIERAFWNVSPTDSLEIQHDGISEVYHYINCISFCLDGYAPALNSEERVLSPTFTAQKDGGTGLML